ncbi:MAG: hypothetical protein GX542_04325 [Rhodococcus sp.]|nr:hypothetical protein [Rhodococcus sp. (in: high G+C Gram-positive bacteria)]
MKTQLRVVAAGILAGGIAAGLISSCGGSDGESSEVDSATNSAAGDSEATSTPSESGTAASSESSSDTRTRTVISCEDFTQALAPVVVASAAPEEIPQNDGSTLCVWVGDALIVSAAITKDGADAEVVQILRDDPAAIEDSRVTELDGVAMRTDGVGVQTPMYRVSVAVSGPGADESVELEAAIAIAQELEG